MADKGPNNGGTEDDDDEELGEAGLNALKRERSDRKKLEKSLKELQDRLDAAEAEKLSKEEAAIKRAEAAERERDELRKSTELRELREKIAEEVELPAKLLRGDNEDDIRTFAKELKEFYDNDSTPRPPQPNPHLGGNSDDQSESDVDALKVLGF